jgi:hypothetical protein
VQIYGCVYWCKCMWPYVCLSVYVCVYVCMCVWVCVCVCVCVCVVMCVCVHVCQHTLFATLLTACVLMSTMTAFFTGTACVITCTRFYIYICMYVCVRVSIYIYIYVYMCVYISVYVRVCICGNTPCSRRSRLRAYSHLDPRLSSIYP